MKIVMTLGCIADSLTIDGVEEPNLTDDKRQEVIDRCVKKIEPRDLNEFLQWLLMRHYDDYECSDLPCECCGDYIDMYTLEI
jgi:hypothetical protein